MYTTNELVVMHRARKKLSQGEVAKAIGVSRMTYSEREKGNSDWTLQNLRDMAELFGIEVNDLIGEEEIAR